MIMRHWMTSGLLAAGLLIATLPAAAQGPWRGRYSNAPVIDRVLSDIDRAGYNGYADRHERNRLENARRDLIRFQDNWARGRFDRDRLDSAIDNLHHVVDSGRIDPRARGLLARDMDILRDFRANRGSGYGYRDRDDYYRRDRDDYRR